MKTTRETKPYTTRTVSDWVGPDGATTVYETVERASGNVVFRSYSRRDAATETAYRNKFGGA